MALIKCPECKGKIALVICFVFLFLCFIISISPKFKLENASTAKAETLTKINAIEDVSKFSRISSKELTDLLGDPVDTENWTNKTSKGNFEVTTISYDLNENHYEFIVADDAVVRLTIYSNDYGNIIYLPGEPKGRYTSRQKGGWCLWLHMVIYSLLLSCFAQLLLLSDTKSSAPGLVN